MNEATIFPEKEKIMSIVKQRFKDGIYRDRSITIEDEIDSYFERINYELAMKKYEDDSLLRYLRKEKSDLLFYLNQSYYSSIEDKNQMLLKILKKRIEDSFEFLLLKYRRR